MVVLCFIVCSVRFALLYFKPNNYKTNSEKDNTHIYWKTNIHIDQSNFSVYISKVYIKILKN